MSYKTTDHSIKQGNIDNEVAISSINRIEILKVAFPNLADKLPFEELL